MPNSYGRADGSAPVVRAPDAPELRITEDGRLALLTPENYHEAGFDALLEGLKEAGVILECAAERTDPDLALRKAIFGLL